MPKKSTADESPTPDSTDPMVVVDLDGELFSFPKDQDDWPTGAIVAAGRVQSGRAQYDDVVECLLGGAPESIVESDANDDTDPSSESAALARGAARTARKRLGLTQPQLALAAGVGVRFIVDLEAGKPTLRLENVLRVMHALGGRLSIDGLPSDA